MKILQPANWARPRGYANGVAARGTHVFISGMVGWNRQGRFESSDFAGQAGQALRNVVEVLAEAQAQPGHIVRMTWYVLDKNEYLHSAKALGAVYREIFGRHYPAMTVVEVSGLVEPSAKLEIEVTAVIPD
jgi:enamine deaminase RidA (YjgF/YER057c/UK114 family)